MPSAGVDEHVRDGGPPMVGKRSGREAEQPRDAGGARERELEKERYRVHDQNPADHRRERRNAPFLLFGYGFSGHLYKETGGGRQKDLKSENSDRRCEAPKGGAINVITLLR